MSHTKKYYVSTTHNGVFKSALVSSGNSKNAAKKFLVHTDPDASLHSDLEKLTDEPGFKEYSIDDYVISVRRINIYDDFTALSLVDVNN